MADMTGSVLMTDGSTDADGKYLQTPYKLVTTDIESVSNLTDLFFKGPSGAALPMVSNWRSFLWRWFNNKVIHAYLQMTTSLS